MTFENFVIRKKNVQNPLGIMQEKCDFLNNLICKIVIVRFNL